MRGKNYGGAFDLVKVIPIPDPNLSSYHPDRLATCSPSMRRDVMR